MSVCESVGVSFLLNNVRETATCGGEKDLLPRPCRLMRVTRTNKHGFVINIIIYMIDHVNTH